MNDLDFSQMTKKQILDFIRTYPHLFKGYSKFISPKKSLISFVKARLKRSNSIKGGIGDKLTFKDISLRELDWGIKIEYEHTKSLSQAMDIAYDHLAEFPYYYSKVLIPAEKKRKRLLKRKS